MGLQLLQDVHRLICERYCCSRSIVIRSGGMRQRLRFRPISSRVAKHTSDMRAAVNSVNFTTSWRRSLHRGYGTVLTLETRPTTKSRDFWDAVGQW